MKLLLCATSKHCFCLLMQTCTLATAALLLKAHLPCLGINLHAHHKGHVTAMLRSHGCRYGDDMAYENSDAYVSEILALVRQQNIHQCNETQGILLEELEFKHMYDACIYFISPHQLRPRDLKFMSAISKVVPVIPIIAKADCMTDEERHTFRSHIHASLQKPNFMGEPLTCLYISRSGLSDSMLVRCGQAPTVLCQYLYLA